MDTSRNHSYLYDALWHVVGADGRQRSLFGDDCAARARATFAACAAGSTLPLVYLEVPLLGKPRFDLQVCIDRDAIAQGFNLPTEAPPLEQRLLEWLASPAADDCRGVDLAFDTSDPDATHPQVIVLMRDGTLADARGFFSLAGASDAAQRYREAERRVPAGWHSWYTGLIPGRPGSPVRLDYFVGKGRRLAYAQDVAHMQRDLAQVGYRMSARERAWCQELLALPCRINLQLDLRDDGTLGPVLGYNLALGHLGPREIRERLEDGWLARALERMEAWGLADARWHQLEDLCRAQALHLRDGARDIGWVSLVCKPTFVKVRMTQDALVDAKAYISCAIAPLRGAASPTVPRGPKDR